MKPVEGNQLPTARKIAKKIHFKIDRIKNYDN